MRIGKVIGDVAEQLPLLGLAAQRLRERRRRRRDCYTAWAHECDTPTAAQLAGLRQASRRFAAAPLISIVMPVCDPPPQLLDDAIAAVRGQVYGRWELCLADNASTSWAVRTILSHHAAADPRIKLEVRGTRGNVSAALNTALTLAGGEYVAVVDHVDLLPPQALYWIVEAVNRHPEAAIIYSDEDQIDDRGRRLDPHLKSDFNHELLLAQDMISRLAVYRRELVVGLGGFRSEYDGAQDHDLALRAAAAVARHQIVHVPRVLYHRRHSPDAAIGPSEAARRSRLAVADHLRRLGQGADVVPAPEASDHHRIRHPVPAGQPLVSIVICTRDHADLLRAAIGSICSKTTYPNYEIQVVDNGSRDPATLDYLASLAGHPRVTVIRDDSPFNYSRLNNDAVARSRGPLLCLLNDDVEVITPTWLEELASQAVRPDVGAVGARLWYPDGTLQHGGVVIGIGGVAGHAHPGLPRGETGYRNRAVLAQEFSAVTGACLMVRREVFEEVGGLDERLSVTFNDIDFCLRLREAGYRNIWTPYAELIHHESASRGPDDSPAKQSRFHREVLLMRDRWGGILDHDPYYNPWLSPRAADFTFSSASHRTRSRHAA